MSKALIKQTETMEVWKIWGISSSDTITLATDCLSPTMTVTGTPTVNINFVTWSVSNGAGPDVVRVTRNSEEILTLYQNGQLDFAGNGGFSDNRQNTSDIIVTITGTGQCYLTLRKVTGWSSKIETAQYGPYDNTTIVGS